MQTMTCCDCGILIERRCNAQRRCYACAKASKKASSQTPEYKAWQKAYQKSYHQTPEYKEYQQTNERKAKEKARMQTPEYKACKNACKQKQANNKNFWEALAMTSAITKTVP